MRRSHFAAFAPHCLACADGQAQHPLGLLHVGAEEADDVRAGLLICANPACRHEYPIIDGIPILVPALAEFLGERAVELLTRDDFDPAIAGVLGDAIGTDTWYDGLRRTMSIYGWDGWADLDPDEAPPGDGPHPGAGRRCLAALLDMAGASAGVNRVLDVGCGTGRTSFDLADRHPDGLVLGLDIGLSLLRIAQGALRGNVAYPRRRIGLVHDQRRFPVAMPAAERVDFWACDAAAPPFAQGSADLIVALNLIDCVPAPRDVLASLASQLGPGRRMLLATPYDWAARSTPPHAWIGGHSQRADDQGDGEPFLRRLLTPGAHAQSLGEVTLLAEKAHWPWHTRLHARATVHYSTHLFVVGRNATPADETPPG